MRKYILLTALLLMFVGGSAMAQTPPPDLGDRVRPLNYGTGSFYYGTMCDTYLVSGTINTAVTTLILSGVANQSIYVCMFAWQSTGTNSANTVQFEYGQGATCGTNTVTLLPSAVAPGTATNEWTIGWGGGSVVANTTVTGVPAPAPFMLITPNNLTPYNLCVVTAGTTTSGKVAVYYAIH